MPSFCSKVMPCGIAKESLPFGPCTSILPACMAIFTPAGTGIGFRPVRGIFSIFLDYEYRLPHFAKNFAAHFGLARRTAAHQPPRCGHDTDAQPAHHGTNIVRAEIRARGGAR